MILNIRPTIYRDATLRAWAHLGLQIVDAPLIVTNRMAYEVPPADQFDVIIFTSQLGVEAFGRRDEWLEKRVFTVGTATENAARGAGFTRVICTGQDARDLTAAMAAEPAQRALYLSGENVTADLAQAFPDRVTRVIVYRTEIAAELPKPVVEKLRASPRVFVPLLSRRSAYAARLAFGRAGLSRRNLNATSVAISLAALDMSVEAPWRAQTVAAEPTIAGIAAEMERHIHPLHRAA